MTTTDIIATGALFVSVASLIYTFYSNHTSKERELKKEKVIFLKSLAKLIRSMTFTHTTDIKNNILDSIREELNFSTCYENNKNFIEFSEELDDNVYSLSQSTCSEDFSNLKERIIENIKSFK